MTTKRYCVWNDTNTVFLKEWWPHFGTGWCAERLNLSDQQVKSKIEKLKISMLPKTERLCRECMVEHQVSRRYGQLCKKCSLNHRKKVREKELPFDSWILDTLRTLKYRSKGKFDLTPEYMKALWEKQKGKCFYSGVDLLEPCWEG